ncbi:hypothetical protein TSUD_35830 [Trifolium subterraneum]|uniref:Auxin-induced protein n=1 Tax=Trifolium subterraneum TaxID=3900 RepID=A0A2Z6N9Z1_TRISU|nr:hypothetical protein TSUD_35830 [Trifolium subterraneum]
MGKGSASSSSSSNGRRRKHNSSNVSSSITHQNSEEHLCPDLNLGLSISATHQYVHSSNSRGHWQQMQQQAYEVNDCNDYNSFFVKVYMEGIPIGRKLNLLAHGCYEELVNTLEQMFDTTILWGTGMDGMQSERCHVLTYEDGEGDLIMVGDVPWEMFLSSVKRLKITRVDAFGF